MSPVTITATATESDQSNSCASELPNIESVRRWHVEKCGKDYGVQLWGSADGHDGGKGALDAHQSNLVASVRFMNRAARTSSMRSKRLNVGRRKSSDLQSTGVRAAQLEYVVDVWGGCRRVDNEISGNVSPTLLPSPLLRPQANGYEDNGYIGFTTSTSPSNRSSSVQPVEQQPLGASTKMFELDSGITTKLETSPSLPRFTTATAFNRKK